MVQSWQLCVVTLSHSFCLFCTIYLLLAFASLCALLLWLTRPSPRILSSTSPFLSYHLCKRPAATSLLPDLPFILIFQVVLITSLPCLISSNLNFSFTLVWNSTRVKRPPRHVLDGSTIFFILLFQSHLSLFITVCPPSLLTLFVLCNVFCQKAHFSILLPLHFCDFWYYRFFSALDPLSILAASHRVCVYPSARPLWPLNTHFSAFCMSS